MPDWMVYYGKVWLGWTIAAPIMGLLLFSCAELADKVG